MLLAVDAYSIIHRAYHAFPTSLVTKDGMLVNAAYGFTTMLLDVLIKYQPDHVFIAFDSPGGTFRHTIFPDYKANRGPSDEDLHKQIPLVKEIVASLNIPSVAEKGYEADDILGTVSKVAHSQENLDVLIVSGDRDLLQLVNKHVSVLLPKGSFKNLVVFNPEKVQEYWGVLPEQVVDLKALMGDASDNIPGVKGIGPKTAQTLITKYGSLEELYKHIDEVTGRTKQLLVDGHDIAFVSQELATIKTDMPMSFELDKCLLSDFQYEVAASMFQKMQFKSLMSKLQKVAKVSPDVVEKVSQTSFLAAPEAYKDWQKAGIASFNKQPKIEPVGEYEVSQSLDVFSLPQKSGQSFVVIYDDSKVRVFSYEGSVSQNAIVTYGWRDWMRAAGRTLEQKAWQDLQDTVRKVLANHTIIDNQLLKYAHIAGRTDYALDGLHWGTEEKAIASAWRVLQDTCNELVACGEVLPNKRIAKLWKQLGKESAAVVNMATAVDTQFAVGIAELERNGIRLDLHQVAVFKDELEAKINELEAAVYEEVGHEFNVRSTQQLGNVLFNELQIPPKRKTKTGYSTDDSVLQELKGVHPVVQLILDYRMHYKLYSTYVLPFLQFTPDKNDKKAVRIHSTFNQLATPTGRLSSTNPNLQNLPIRSELGKKIRTFFTGAQGTQLISLDYSQIDLRVMAHISQDKRLIADFVEGKDIHRSTASTMFKTPYDEVTDAQRRVAKTINFGVIYGISAFGLATSLQIDFHEAQEYINDYFDKYQGIAKYIHDTIEFVTRYGYVESLLGRRRVIVGMDTRNPARRNGLIREAINMPIQGGSDDIMRLALNALEESIQSNEEWRQSIKLVLHIHDELVFEVRDDETLIASFSEKAKDIMEHVIKLDVPLMAGVEHDKHL